MISRHWNGLAQKHRAEEYIDHLKHDTFREIGKIPGFVDAQILKRELEEGVEFLIVTQWRDIDAIRKFAGEDLDTAVVPNLVQEIMIRYDKKVRHYEVNHQTS